MNDPHEAPHPEPFDGPNHPGCRRIHTRRHGRAAAIAMLGMAGPGFGPGQFGGPFGPGGPFRPGGPMHGGHGRGGARRGHVRTSILALLAETQLNGYQIMQTLAERTGGAWKPSPGTVYPTLSQLEDEGLIESFDNNGQKAFQLTDAGRKAAEGIEQKPWDLINEHLGGFNPQLVKALWSQWDATAGALNEFSRTASPAQLQTATKLIADTRRALYGLLAEDAGADAVPNSDDLR